MSPLDSFPGSLAQRDIVWARVADPRGHVKRRPVIIVTATDEIILDGPIAAVAISSTLPETLTREYVDLPWSHLGHPATRLSRRSAAVCNWQVQLRPSDVDEVKGFVPTKTMIGILDRMRDLETD